MNSSIKEALNEILEMPPMYRRDLAITYVRQNLPEEEARKCLFEKKKNEYLIEMLAQGHAMQKSLLEIIGPQRVRDFLQSTNDTI